jgi:hypothetical protein
LTCATEYTQWLQANIAYVHAQARKHLDVKLKAQKTYLDRKLRERSFEVGEKVLWLRPNVAKLENVWQGPYVVVNKEEEWHYFTLEKDGKHRRATANQQRQYHENEVESDIRFGHTRSVPENEDESDVQPPLPGAENAIEQVEIRNGSEAENGCQPPLSRVMVQEMTSSDDSEIDESPEVRLRRKGAKPCNSYEGRLRPREKAVQQRCRDSGSKVRDRTEKPRSPVTTEITKAAQ